MTKTFTLLASAAMAIALTACASTDDKYSVGVDDNDRFASNQDNTDVELSDAQKFGINDDDKFEAMTGKEMMMKGNPTVGGVAMDSGQTIVTNASNAPNLSTLVSAVAQAELVETLSGDGPFTVFAPTNTAFSMLPAGTVDSLMMDSKRADLQKVLKGHVVSGTMTSAQLAQSIMSNGGTYTLTTVSGDTLSAFMSGEDIKIADERGFVALVTTADVMQKNGVVHVINSVLIGE